MSTIAINIPADAQASTIAEVRDAINAQLDRIESRAIKPGSKVKSGNVVVTRAVAAPIDPVREWARKKGIPVGNRGRISAELREQYDAAQDKLRARREKAAKARSEK